MRRKIVALLTGVLALVWISNPVDAQNKPYSPKNGILNVKALLFGGGFRVSTAIPLHGNFAHYRTLEIVHPESLIGKDIPAEFLEKLGVELQTEFEKGGHFAEVKAVRSFDAGSASFASAHSMAMEDFREADSLDVPMRHAEDMQVFDKQRQQAEQSEESAVPGGTLIVRCQVIDYAKGNKILQLSMLDVGNAILTLRFSYFDKETGEELGRSIISSDNSSRIIPSALSSRTVLNGIADGLVDQITRRKIAAER
jgi:hypothetical protein